MNTNVIVAQATPPGVSGVSIVRLSGSDNEILKLIPLLSNIKNNDIMPRQATYTTFFDSHRNIIDEGILIYFPAPHSYTGESVVEFQSHGGVIVPRLIIQACVALGCRQAEPGEFSLRAVLNDKMSTLKAEAICGLIHADNEAQARAALRSMKGDFSIKVTRIEKRIKQYRVMLESSIDFDGEDINPTITIDELQKLSNDIAVLYSETKQAVSANHDQHICLIGRPNAGKSSWLNRLLKDDVAIVNEEAGTTRDLIEKRILIQNKWVQITDTAGIRNTTNEIEREGVKRAIEKVDSVDLVIWVVDVDELDDLASQVDHLPEGLITNPERLLILWNKKDIRKIQYDQLTWNNHTVYPVSSFDDRDTQYVLDLISEKIVQPTFDSFYARQRHLNILVKIKKLTDDIYNQSKTKFDIVLVAEVMREIQLELDKLVGLFSTDELLGEIFGSFCIGK